MKMQQSISELPVRQRTAGGKTVLVIHISELPVRQRTGRKAVSG